MKRATSSNDVRVRWWGGSATKMIWWRRTMEGWHGVGLDRRRPSFQRAVRRGVEAPLAAGGGGCRVWPAVAMRADMM
jgi:hypothetical protein